MRKKFVVELVLDADAIADIEWWHGVEKGGLTDEQISSYIKDKLLALGESKVTVVAS